MKKTYNYIIPVAFWSVMMFLTGLLSFNALHYYTFSPYYGILPEKQEAFTNWLWTISLYVHMGTGVVCLGIPLVLFIGLYFGLEKKWHRLLGKIYVIDTILFVVPTGMYMALFAKGGTSTQIGFLVQGVLLGITTYVAFVLAKNRQLIHHKQWMIRSYAFASAVITFRVLHILFYYIEIPYIINYELSQWLCLLVNAFVAEAVIAYQNNFNSISLKQIQL